MHCSGGVSHLGNHRIVEAANLQTWHFKDMFASFVSPFMMQNGDITSEFL